MTRLLGLLFLFDLSMFGYLGLRLYREIQRTKWFAARMEEHRVRADALESEVESLRRYAGVADLEEHAVGIVSSARAHAHELCLQYEKYAHEVLAWAEAAFESATAQAVEIVRGAKSQAKTQPLHYGNRPSPIYCVVEGPIDPPVEVLPARVVSHPARRSRARQENWLQNEILFDVQRRVA